MKRGRIDGTAAADTSSTRRDHSRKNRSSGRKVHPGMLIPLPVQHESEMHAVVADRRDLPRTFQRRIRWVDDPHAISRRHGDARWDPRRRSHVLGPQYRELLGVEAALLPLWP
jgi:hypothetical protein